MALLGSSIDPRLFQQDYSGFTNAAAIQAAGMLNLGKDIAGGIEKYGQMKQERKKLDAGIKASVTGIESAIKMGKNLGIDIESSLSPFLQKINDPNVSPLEAAAYAQEASNSLGNALNFLNYDKGMRAVKVQEGQLQKMPSYFGPPSGQGGTFAGAIPLPSQDYVPPGFAGVDISNLNSLMKEAAKVRVPPDTLNSIIGGIENALMSGTADTGKIVEGYNKQIAQEIADAAKTFTPAKDASGKPFVQIVEDDAGNTTRYTKTIGGQLIDETGNVFDNQGRPVEPLNYRQFDSEAIFRSLNQDPSVLPPLPETSMRSPVGTPQEQAAVASMVAEGQPMQIASGNAAPNTSATESSLASYEIPSSSLQESPRQGVMAQESVAASKAEANEDYTKLTQLTPRKTKLYESALNQSYQDRTTAPSQDVVDEMKQQLLMQPENKGLQIMSETEYGQRNQALINKATKRVGDRSAAESILSRFDTAQKLANHPEGSKVFGKSIPEATLRELARTQGGVYALYYNLKGQDLVQAMRDVKAQSGTAAGMSEKETLALQRAVNDLDLSQDWKSAQESLMRISSGTVRAGKKMGLDESVFKVMPMTPASKSSPASQRQTTRAAEILNNPESTPIFKDEMEYFEKLEKAKSRRGSSSGAGTAPSTSGGRPEDVLFNLNKQFDL